MPFGGGGEGEGGNGGGNGGGDYGGGYGGGYGGAGFGGEGEFGSGAGPQGGGQAAGEQGGPGGGLGRGGGYGAGYGRGDPGADFGDASGYGRGTNTSAGGLGGFSYSVTTGDIVGTLASMAARAAGFATGPLGMLAGYAIGKGYDATFGSDDAPVGTVNFSGVTSSMSDFSSSGTPEAPGDAEGPEGRGRERARAYVRARSQFKDESPPGTTQLNIVSGGGTVPTIPRRSAIKSKGPISSRQNFVNRLGATAVNDIENPATTSTGAII